MNRCDFDEAYRSLIAEQAFLEREQYYQDRKERYWNTLRRLSPFLSPGSRVLDIGGRRFALLTQRLFRCRPKAADIDSRYRASVESAGIVFHHLNLVQEAFRFDHPFNLVVLGEVIGHVPVPRHLVFTKLAAKLALVGRIAPTKPNLLRLHNVIRMLIAKPLFEHFVPPGKDMPPGHFTEYDVTQARWQMEFAGLEVDVAEYAQLNLGGATLSTRTIRSLLSSLLWLRPVVSQAKGAA